VIRLENVAKQYRHQESGCLVTALSGVDLQVAPGELVCVTGPSGCGKSTLLNLVAGFEKASSGRILFDRAPVLGPGPDRGVVFQDNTLFPWLSVLGNVEFGLRAMGMTRGQRREIALDCLRLVGLEGSADSRPYTLSGGMKKRVSLARILAMDSRAWLMDEPFSALDAHARDRLQEELIRIWEQHQRSVLFVTHNVTEAAFLADRVVIMGPAPTSIRRQIKVELPRPRSRTSTEMLALIATLDEELRTLPCCVPPNGVVDERPIET
jgi:NitT/TauT family transport system ATP-binding protein